MRRTRGDSPTTPLGWVAVVPLRAGAEIVGALQLCDGGTRWFDMHAVETYESLGHSIGIAIDREVATPRQVTIPWTPATSSLPPFPDPDHDDPKRTP